MFIDPIFTKEIMEKELNDIENEYNDDINQDEWKI